MPWLGFLGLGFRGICLGWGVSVGLGDLLCGLCHYCNLVFTCIYSFVKIKLMNSLVGVRYCKIIVHFHL